jgi:large subunit ribosomal protein L13
MKTYSVKKADIKRQWRVVDAADRVLGEVATDAAKLLMGKHKPYYTTNLDVGDYVVVINAEKVRVTGNKAQDKIYYSHSGYPGGLKSVSFEKLIKTHPERVIERAVKGMLPQNRLGDSMFRKLKVYAGGNHPYEAQTKAKSTEASTEKN